MHTAFLPELRPRASGCRIDVEADHRAAVSRLSPALQDVFRRQVYPHF